MSKTANLAAIILADRHKTSTNHHNIVPCFVCGHTFVYRGRRGAASVWIGSDDDGYPSPDTSLNGRFCSLRCQDWYDAGNPRVTDQKIVYRWRDDRPMRMGPNGFTIDCANCRKEFESLGLRCCTLDCERSYRERQDNLAIMAEAGIEPAPKRQCSQCNAIIPMWRNGRKVSSKTRVCSPKCAYKARKQAKMAQAGF